MSSLTRFKNLFATSWKMILAFVLGVLAHEMYIQWCPKSSMSSLSSIFPSRKKLSKVVSPKKTNIEAYDPQNDLTDVANSIRERDIPLPVSGIETLPDPLLDNDEI